MADQSAEQVQRRYFAEAVAERFTGFSEVDYPDWRSAFRALAREASRISWHGPFVVDEFPYMVNSCPSLPSVLQSWLDHDAEDAGLLVAIAGSTQHMMQGLALDSSSPLYGRTVESIALQPMSAGYIGAALSLKDPMDCVRAFTVWGGIPRYWELAQPYGTSIQSAIEELVLDPMGPLHHEPDRLLRGEMPPAVSLRPLLDVIGAGAHRVSEIGGRLGQPATSLARPLARLRELGLVSREQPFGTPEQSGKRSLYRIRDPFFRFWFRVVAPHRATLAIASPSVRTRLWKKAWPGLVSETWESLCRLCVPRFSDGFALFADHGPWGVARRFWRAGQPEWDVVALSLDERTLLLGEAKWHEREATVADVEAAYRELTQKGIPLTQGLRFSQVVHVVFVPKCVPEVKSKRRPYAVVDAEEVLGALG